MNEVKRYHFSAISCDEPSIGEMEERDYGDYVKLSDFQSERAARIAAETKLAELEDANQKLRELYYTERKDLAQFREYADTYYPDLWDCFENSRARSKS